MTNQQHPITPPPELVRQWQSESPFKVISVAREDYMIDRAAASGSKRAPMGARWVVRRTGAVLVDSKQARVAAPKLVDGFHPSVMH